jgi:cell division protein FtsB
MKQIITIAIIIFLCTVVVNLSFSIVSLWSKKDVLTATRQQLVQEQQENGQLQKDWQKVNNPSFVEEQARDKLFLGKPGESLVLLPTASPSAKQAEHNQQKSVWQQWLALFF